MEEITVNVDIGESARASVAPRLTWPERVILRIGVHPDRMGKWLDRASIVLACGAIPYAIWTSLHFWARPPSPGWTMAQVWMAGFGWAPLMALQPILGAFRFACMTLAIKDAEEMARAMREGMLQTMALTVANAIRTAHQEQPEGRPTIQ